MGHFIPEVGQVDTNWLSRWGDSFNSPQLAKGLFENPRLRDRVYQQMLLDSEIDVAASFDDSEMASLLAFSNHREKLKTVCGLVVHGAFIRSIVTKADFETLSKAFKPDDLQLALKLRDVHPAQSNFAVDLSKLGNLVKRAGKECVDRWRGSARPQLKLRLDLVDLPEDTLVFERSEISNDVANSIVKAASVAIQNKISQ